MLCCSCSDRSRELGLALACFFCSELWQHLALLLASFLHVAFHPHICLHMHSDGQVVVSEEAVPLRAADEGEGQQFKALPLASAHVVAADIPYAVSKSYSSGRGSRELLEARDQGSLAVKTHDMVFQRS